jgi:hypothetical protein
MSFFYFLSERMRTVSPEEWAAILDKAKQKKAQEEVADPTTALVVQDTTSSKGVKRRRKMGVAKAAKSLKVGPIAASASVDLGVEKDVIDHARISRDEEASHVVTGEDVPPPSPPPVVRTVGVTMSSPLGDTFDPEEFIRTNFMLEGNLDMFDSMDVREIRKLALGYEFKGLMLNYFLSARQERDVEVARKRFEGKLEEMRQKMERSHATSIEELVENHRSALKTTKSACESRVDALKEVYARDRLVLEDKLRASEKNDRNLIKSRNRLIVALAMAEDDAAGFEDEVVELVKSNSAVKDSLGEKYAEGFAAALDQVKVLFPDLDETILGEVDLLKFVEDGKLMSRIPPQ